MLVVTGVRHGNPSSEFSTVPVTQLVCTYVHAYPFIMYWPRLFAKLNSHYDVGYQGLEIYQVSSSTVNPV